MGTNYQVWECRGYGVNYQVAAYNGYEEACEDASNRTMEAESSDHLRNGNDDSYYYEVREY